MFVGAAVLFVALAVSQADAQNTREYDLPDCRIYDFASYSHHVGDPNNCLVFYNCDNNHGGKKVWCPEGTIYDNTLRICVGNGRCNAWSRKASCQVNPANVMNFTGLFCDSYFTYYCKSQTFLAGKCPNKQWFNKDRRVCTSAKPAQGSCKIRNPVLQRGSGDRCEDARIVYVDPCHYKDVGRNETRPLATGTVMDRSCLMHISDFCHQKPVCGKKQVYIPTENVFKNEPAATIFEDNKKYTISRFIGAELAQPSTDLTMKFTVRNPQSGYFPVLQTAQTWTENGGHVAFVSCNETRLNVKVNHGQILVDVGQGHLQANVNSQGLIVLTLHFKKKGNEATVSVTSPSSRQTTTVPITTTAKGCEFTIGGPSIHFTEFSYVQLCSNPN